MRRVMVNVSDDFYQLIEDYKLLGGRQSWPAALLELASIGYKTVTGNEAPRAVGAWGGKRKPDDLEDVDDCRNPTIAGKAGRKESR